MKNSAWFRFLSAIFRNGIYGMAIVAGLFYIYQGLDLLPTAQPAEIWGSEIEAVSEEPTAAEKISFEEHCRRNPVSTCWDNSQTTDFLYAEDEQIAVVKAEEFSPNLLEQAIKSKPQELNRIAELLENNTELQVNPQTSEMFSELQQLNQNALDKMYEEELPDDVLDVEHLSNPKLQGKNLLPSHKPPYFGDKPVLAIVIDDMGISAKRTADIASLQAPLTVAFLTYGRNLSQQVENSRKTGQEIMIHVPMEAQKSTDAAPDVLTTQMNDNEIQDNLQVMLAKFHDVKGINNHMGSKLTEDKERMTAVMKVLKQKDLFFLDSKTTASSKAEIAAKESGVAYAHRHVFIDNNNDKDYILGQLAKAEDLARKNGYAIAIGHPKTQTFAALQEWLPKREAKGIVLEPLSAIVAELNPAQYHQPIAEETKN